MIKFLNRFQPCSLLLLQCRGPLHLKLPNMPTVSSLHLTSTCTLKLGSHNSQVTGLHASLDSELEHGRGESITTASFTSAGQTIDTGKKITRSTAFLNQSAAQGNTPRQTAMRILYPNY